MPLTALGGASGTTVIGDTTSGVFPQTLHPATMAYQAILKSGASYTMDNTELNAINNLVWALVGNGLWDKIQVLYPFIGSTSSAQSYNLKTPSTFQITWVGAAATWSTANGFQKTSTATSTYGNTTYTPNTSATLNSIHISVYLGTTQSAAPIVPIGAFNNSSWLQIASGTGSGVTNGFHTAIQGTGTSTIATWDIGATNYGCVVGSRTSSTSNKGYYNGYVKATATPASGNLPTIPVWIGGENASSSLLYPCTQAIRFASIGTGLTDAEARALTMAIQAFQQKLGRAITF